MIQGVVNTFYEPVIRLAVQGPSGQTREIEAVVDTGYNGYLMLPPALALELELPFVTTNPVFLADGSEIIFNVHSVTALWDGCPRYVDVHISDTTPLIGMRLLDRYNLNIEVVDGGRVVIESRESN